MKKLLAGTVIATGLLTTVPAYALFGMGDIVFDPNAFTQLVQQVKQGAEWINNQMEEIRNQLKGLDFMSDTLNEATKIYDQAQSMFYAVNHITSIGGAMSALSMLGIRNPLPLDPGMVIGLANGTGSISGFAHSVPSLFRSTYDNNHIYDATGPAYQATLLRERATANAGMQSVAGQLYESMGKRLDTLADLQGKIDGSDAKDLAALQARVAVEQTAIQAQQVQAQALSVMQTAGWRAIDQRNDEIKQRNIDAVLASTGADTF